MKAVVYLFFAVFYSAHLLAGDTTILKSLKLGTTKVNVVTKCFIECDSNISFINVHENESTSVEAAENFLINNGGTLTQLIHSGERYISFYIGKKKFYIDPNRIYTKKGIAATLKKLGHFNAEAAKKVDSFASQILQNFVDGKKLVVALHNNTDNNYSIESYKIGGDEAINAASVFINEQMDPDDFVVTTDSTLFNLIKEKNITVVLQNNKRVLDDGSLSVYAARKNIPYLNIEAQEDHQKEQLDILKALKDIILQFGSIFTVVQPVEAIIK